MNKEDIIRMAREAGFDHFEYMAGTAPQIERFAALVAKAEREAWRQEREQLMTQIGVLRSQILGMRMQFGEGSTVSNLSAALQAEDAVNAATIRARGMDERRRTNDIT